MSNRTMYTSSQPTNCCLTKEKIMNANNSRSTMLISRADFLKSAGEPLSPSPCLIPWRLSQIAMTQGLLLTANFLSAVRKVTGTKPLIHSLLYIPAGLSHFCKDDHHVLHVILMSFMQSQEQERRKAVCTNNSMLDYTNGLLLFCQDWHRQGKVT